jgi:hypothetical protein
MKKLNRTVLTPLVASRAIALLPCMRPAPPLVRDAADEFLRFKSHVVKKSSMGFYAYALKDLVRLIGHLRIHRVRTADISKALHLRNRRESSEAVVLRVIKSLFDWSRSQGHLPLHLPTEAESIHIRVTDASRPRHFGRPANRAQTK